MIYERVYEVSANIAFNEEEAIELAESYCWGEVETSEQNIAYSNHIDTINGVGIHYCYGADHYFFTDEGE